MSDNFYQNLKFLVEKLQGINYALIGSANLYLRGFKLEPKDIDIFTNSEEIFKIDSILQEYRTKEIYFDAKGLNSYLGYYRIDDVDIEIQGNVNNPCRYIESLGRKEQIMFKSIVSPCISLLDELETYKKMNRLDKVKLVEDFLRINC